MLHAIFLLQIGSSVALSSFPTPILIETLPHDPKAFTQGLIYKDGYLYESTGLYGRSSVRKVEVATGKAVREVLAKL
jgi:glutamine cyclotransferase